MKLEKLYNGPLNPLKMKPIAKKGYISYTNQKSKCENKKNPDYKYYGKKGIKVIYSRIEFITWWIREYKNKKWKDPTTGRIDHNKSYDFNNIMMQERADNSLERIKRLGEYRCDKPVNVYKNNVFIKTFKSATAASVYVKKSNSTVVRICNNNYISGGKKKKKTTDNYSFKYKEMSL